MASCAGNGLLLADGSAHQTRRRLLMPCFTQERMVRDVCTLTCVATLSELCRCFAAELLCASDVQHCRGPWQAAGVSCCQQSGASQHPGVDHNCNTQHYQHLWIWHRHGLQGLSYSRRSSSQHVLGRRCRPALHSIVQLAVTTSILIAGHGNSCSLGTYSHGHQNTLAPPLVSPCSLKSGVQAQSSPPG